MSVEVKRVYDPCTPDDGVRVLVDRIWPRGVGKNELEADAWEKDVAPTTDLRKWFGQEPGRWTEFQHRYRQELEAEPAASVVTALVERARNGKVTLLYAAGDRERNGAIVLRDVIAERMR